MYTFLTNFLLTYVLCRYDWKSFLTRYFLPLKGIQKFHSFRFIKDDLGAVFVKERSGSPELRVQLMRRNIQTVPHDVFPDPIAPAGISRARQDYLFRHVRPYVRPAFQDITCPGITEE
jgi:hypothetical protein